MERNIIQPQKEGNSTIDNNIGGTWGYYVKWNKWDRETNTIWFHF